MLKVENGANDEEKYLMTAYGVSPARPAMLHRAPQSAASCGARGRSNYDISRRQLVPAAKKIKGQATVTKAILGERA